MGYIAAIEATLGGKVLDSRLFGAWQGYWVARIGPDAYVWGYYGSCGLCDGYQAWADRLARDANGDRDWEHEPSQEQLASYGRRLLKNPQTRDELLWSEDFGPDAWSEGREVREWLLSL